MTAKVLTYLEKIENSVLRMVNKEQFEEICNKYRLDSKRLIKNNENIIKKANYADICYVLDYLIGTLKIFPSN